jgi:hypothetical protein
MTAKLYNQGSVKSVSLTERELKIVAKTEDTVTRSRG